MAISNADIKIHKAKRCRNCKHYQWGDNYLSNNLHPCVRSLSSEEAEDSAIMIIGKYSQILYGPDFGCIHFELSLEHCTEEAKLLWNTRVVSDEQLSKCSTCKNAVPISRGIERVFFCQKGDPHFTPGCKEYATYEKPKSDPKELLCKTCFNLSENGMVCDAGLENHVGPGWKTILCKKYFSKDSICFSCLYHYPDRENLLGIEDKPCVICLKNRPTVRHLPPDAYCSDRKNVWFGGVSYHREEVIARIIDGRKAEFREIRENMIAEEIADTDFSRQLDYKKYYAKPRNEEPEICRTCVHHEKIEHGHRTHGILYSGKCEQQTGHYILTQDDHTCADWKKHIEL